MTRMKRWRRIASAALICTMACVEANQAQAQTYEPAAEDLALVADLLSDRIDITPERIVYVAPPGPADGDGTRANPRRDLISVVKEAQAGTAIHLAPGIYYMSAVRNQFGHVDSTLWTGESGAANRPIVLRTDPDAYDPGSGAIAVLDFDYDNDPPGWRTSAFVVRDSFWVFERFEMRRMQTRGFWVNVGAYNNTFRELDLHHADFPGTNNEALILMAASGGVTNNVIIGCHLHHAGVIDRATDTLLDRGSGNGGCFYSETRFTYDSGEPAAGHDATLAEWEAEMKPPDGHVYLIGNHVHDCHYGLGLKNLSRGPYFFLSNHIHDVDEGIRCTFTDSLIRNNILRGAGIHIGRAVTDTPRSTFFKMTGNGARAELAYNTLIDGDIVFQGGWSSSAHHNLVIDAGAPIDVQRNQYYWWEDGSWPGIRGEFLIDDLGPSHAFFDLMPGYMQELAGKYTRLKLEDNCYDQEPAIPRADFTQPIADVTGQVFDQRHTLLTATERSALFVDEAGGDYRRVEGDGFDCGSRIGALTPLPTPDAGMIDAGGDSGGGADDSGPATGADSGVDAAVGPSPKTDEGCSCSLQSSAGPSLVEGLLFALALFGLGWLRRRR